MSAFLS